MSATAPRPPTIATPLDEGVRTRRWTREEYHRAAELGLFRPEERLELLDGEILEKMTQKSPHAIAVLDATDALGEAFGAGRHVRPQMPLILDDESEPEPDVVVVPGKRRDFLAGHPRASDALLVLEVADTTLRYDRETKQVAYARSGIPEYWIVNLVDRQVEVYRDPIESGYRSVTVHREGDDVGPLAATQAAVSVADLLPPIPTFEEP